MKTLSQIRTAHALKHKGSDFKDRNGSDEIPDFALMIRNHGFLSALTCACERGREVSERRYKGRFAIARVLAEHLSAPGVRVCISSTADALLDELAKGDAMKLRMATTEALAFLSTLKRIAS